MIVFKTYLKVILHNKSQIFINLIVFLGITIFFVISNGEVNSFDNSSYSNIKVGYVIKEDNEKNKGLVKYLDKTFTLTEYNDDDTEIKDALFYKSVDYVILLEKDNYESYQRPNSTSSFIVKNYINNYLNTYKSFASAKIGDEDKIVKMTLDNLKQGIKVVNYQQDNNNVIKNMGKFYNMYVYGLLGCIIIGVGIVMVSFNSNKVFERTVASSMSVRKRNLIMYAGHAAFGLAMWLIMTIASFIYFKDVAFNTQHQMLLINSFIFVFPTTALAFMISQFVRNYTVVGAINNVVSLGLSFISGAFIPQMVLGAVVLRIASFTPAYWFVLNNDKIVEMTSFDLNNLLEPMLIQIGFGIAFIAVGIAIAKLKTSNKFK